MTAPSASSSVCSSRMTRALTTFRPASIIVANWREKIWSDFGLTFLPPIEVGADAAALGELLDRLGEQALDAELLAGRAQVGGADLPGELGSLGVDRRIGKGGHTLDIGRGSPPLEGSGARADT